VYQERLTAECLVSIQLADVREKSCNYLVAESGKSEKGNRLNMKILTLKPFAVCVAILGVAGMVSAQNDLNLPDISQAAEVKQRIALTDITVKYHRPLVNGRKIWGGLVPYGKVWRAGANENTTIEFSDPVSIEGQPLPKGTYGLHMIPNPDSWTVIFSKTNTGWGSYSYDQKDDALRVNVKPKSLADSEEALEFEFEDLKPDSTAVTLKWEKMGVPFTVSVKDSEQTLENIRAQLKGRGQFTWQALDEAAQFCLTRKINLDEALRWADASIQNEERFDNLSTKADILKALNRPDEAKTTWNHAIDVATAPQLYSYGRRLQNQKQNAEALETFKEVDKRFPQGVFGDLARARIKSAAGDFAGAASDARKAQAAAPTDAQKQSIKALIDRLDAKQDINK
jgi:tetratricopeptide (TPR) repeat protein